MLDESSTNDPVMAAVVAALASPPSALPPDDFVARTMARLPAHPSRVRRQIISYRQRSAYGQRVAWTCFAVLLIAMFSLAARSGGSTLSAGLQIMALLQLFAVALVLAATYRIRGRG